MTLLQKLQAIATTMQDILDLSSQVRTELTSLSTFLDTVWGQGHMARARPRHLRRAGRAHRHSAAGGNQGRLRLDDGWSVRHHGLLRTYRAAAR